METYNRPTALVVAAIGYHSASRCILINPVPHNATEDSLKEYLSRFGPVERMEIRMNKVEEKYFVRVHFFSIESALKVFISLPSKEDMKEAKIHFGTECFDLRFRNHKRAVQEKRQARTSLNVALNGFARSSIAMKSLRDRIEQATAPYHVHGEALRSITHYTNGDQRNILLQFMRAEDAKLFHRIFNSQSSAAGNREVKAIMDPPTPKWLNSLQFACAVRLGATRKLCIESIRGWGLIDRDQILEDFSRFGPIANVSISESGNRAYITFNTINHATNVICQIYADQQTFRRYAGTEISFFQHPESTIPPPLPLRILCD
ncbi:hypothetical protein L218DRAFT_1078238 [Marasmius fiardii PR-910]|nr:hypothetical protein L218DRAFT_1078238 [Marasmius fiardii PR-910]